MKIRYLILLILLGFIGYTAYEVKFFPHRNLSNPSVLLEIKPGTKIKGIVDELERQGLTHASLKMTLFLYVNNLMHPKTPLQAGEYQIPANTNPFTIAKKMMEGDKIRRTFTIPEGYNVREVAKVLASKGLLTDQETFVKEALSFDAAYFMGIDANNLEGYLFPDTYEYSKNMTKDQILRKMVDNFKRHFDENMQRRAKELHMTPAQVVTLASIIEKETAQEAERPLISSVFHNRLKKGIPLATDPTVIYGIKNFDGNLRKEDLRRDGPYNTYIRKGLPPTPIANPGLKSLQAALNPAESEYLFFVSRGNGTHQFSITLAEHEAAVKKYQQAVRPESQKAVP